MFPKNHSTRSYYVKKTGHLMIGFLFLHDIEPCDRPGTRQSKIEFSGKICCRNSSEKSSPWKTGTIGHYILGYHRKVSALVWKQPSGNVVYNQEEQQKQVELPLFIWLPKVESILVHEH